MNISGRRVVYGAKFPDTDKFPPALDGHSPASIIMQIAKGGTAMDIMIAAADKDSKFNFWATYYGNMGYSIDAIRGAAKKGSGSWVFYYKIPGVSKEIKSFFGVSNVVIPGDNWEIIMRYEKD